MNPRIERSLGNAAVEEGKAEEWLNLVGIPILKAIRSALNSETRVIASDASGELEMEGSELLFVLADATQGPLTFVLPADAKLGNRVCIKHGGGSSGTHNIDIDTPPDVFIDGGISHVIDTNYGYLWFLFDGENWARIG